MDKSDRLSGLRNLRASSVSSKAHFEKKFKVVPGLVVKPVTPAAQDAETEV